MRKVCVFTGTRAEYGLLYWTMREIQDDPDLQLQLLVSGAHLSKSQGETYKQIEADGFQIDAKVAMNLDDDSALGLARVTGQGMSDLAETLSHLKPDVLVILGDRYEAFAAASAAMMLRIPIAHIHGGEVTEGAIDDAIRHSITKMAHLHFTAAEPYRQRVVQLGESPERVFNVGAPGLETIKRTELMSRENLARDLDFSLDGTVFVVTYHPVTLGSDDPAAGVEELLRALDGYPKARIIFTKANADMHGQAINDRLEAYADAHNDRVYLTASLGQRRYYSAVALADAVIGNSSSGIIEVPDLGTACVNIGDRQQGRLRAASVIDCSSDANAVAAAIDEALTDSFQSLAERTDSPYGNGDSAAQIVSALKGCDLSEVLHKSFYDFGGGNA